jgi:hypothetical protein
MFWQIVVKRLVCWFVGLFVGVGLSLPCISDRALFGAWSHPPGWQLRI